MKERLLATVLGLGLALVGTILSDGLVQVWEAVR